jgi:hypothetical protein
LVKSGHGRPSLRFRSFKYFHKLVLHSKISRPDSTQPWCWLPRSTH